MTTLGRERTLCLVWLSMLIHAAFTIVYEHFSHWLFLVIVVLLALLCFVVYRSACYELDIYSLQGLSRPLVEH